MYREEYKKKEKTAEEEQTRRKDEKGKENDNDDTLRRERPSGSSTPPAERERTTEKALSLQEEGRRVSYQRKAKKGKKSDAQVRLKGGMAFISFSSRVLGLTAR